MDDFHANAGSWDCSNDDGYNFWLCGVEVAEYKRSMWKILVGLEKFAKVSESLITFLLKLEKKLWFSFWFYTPRGLARSDSTRRIWLHAVRQHLIRPRQCVNLHFIPCVTSDCMRSWDRARLQPCGKLCQCAQAFIPQILMSDSSKNFFSSVECRGL